MKRKLKQAGISAKSDSDMASDVIREPIDTHEITADIPTVRDDSENTSEINYSPGASPSK